MFVYDMIITYSSYVYIYMYMYIYIYIIYIYIYREREREIYIYIYIYIIHDLHPAPLLQARAQHLDLLAEPSLDR